MSSNKGIRKKPNLLFEISWEVCNMVGGIYTVLATKAERMTEIYGDNYITIGPNIWREEPQGRSPELLEESFAQEAVHRLAAEGIPVVTGRWNVPGKPRCILVDFSQIYRDKNSILEWLWTHYQVDSITGGWDYVEPVLYGYAAGRVIEVLLQHENDETDCIAHWHEWMTAAGMLYLLEAAPETAHTFTTHATILGRSIAGTGEDLKTALEAVDAETRATNLGIRAKFSMEKSAVIHADTTTTVSSITAKECEAFYKRKPDLLLPNGLGSHFPNPEFTKPEHRAAVREDLFQVAEKVSRRSLDRDNCYLLLNSGRYEYINKGINLVADALPQIGDHFQAKNKTIVAFFMLPSAVHGPQPRFSGEDSATADWTEDMCTHILANPDHDPLLHQCRNLGLNNAAGSDVIVIFVPVYLDGDDGVFNRRYYELLAGFDLTLFPSHYEPWGYTPLESVGYGIPTITTNNAGFGLWAAGFSHDLAVQILPRDEMSYEACAEALAESVIRFLDTDEDGKRHASDAAFKLAERANWDLFARHYEEAHQEAILKRNKRHKQGGRRISSHQSKLDKPRQVQVEAKHHQPGPKLRPFMVLNRLPEPLNRLRELAYNLWWAWHPEAKALFMDLEPGIWKASGHNPQQLLDLVSQETLDRLAQDKDYVVRLNKVLKAFDTYMKDREEARSNPKIAYFCMEYGIHECLANYSGGLGVLAGDHLKEASDAGLPLIAVGLAYHKGYFLQRFDLQGNQVSEPSRLDFSALPMKQLKNEKGETFTTRIILPGRKLTIQVWLVEVGSVRLYLLDTDHPANTESDRQITANLYGGNKETRLQQEILLGIGGRNVLKDLGIEPSVWHMNEGHAAFLILSRAANVMRRAKVAFRTALEYCRQTSVFTTHTPVPAGHDTFSEDMMRPYFSIYQQILNLSWNEIMELGRYPNGGPNQLFSMTLLALRGSTYVNGVSRIHGGVSQRDFNSVVPDYHWSEVPVGYVTNGVHVPTWLNPDFQKQLDAVLKGDWRAKGFSDKDLEKIARIDDQAFRDIRLNAKRRLFRVLKNHLTDVWRRRQDEPALLNRILSALREDALVIGFARRFAPYKRATLLFRDLKELERIVSQSDKPVIFLFAGKAHPADEMGKALARDIFQITRTEPFLGKILLLENYDMGLAKHLVQGCDIWLNNPTRPLEASGTSGMKAAMNGGPNLSVLDGWWAEGYNGKNGWAIGGTDVYDSPEYQDEFDSRHLYHLLEHTILPLYFEPGRENGISDGWLKIAKESMVSTIREFSTSRMIGQYRETFYEPALAKLSELSKNHYQLPAEAAAFKKKLLHVWSEVEIVNFYAHELDDESVHHGEPIDIEVTVRLPHLSAQEVYVEFVFGNRDPLGELQKINIIRLEPVSRDGENVLFKGQYKPTRSGAKSYGARVVPRFPIDGSNIQTDLNLVTWA